ncbi:MAG: hypothetical protein Q8Q09_10340 [Deltaproteobacteria bacterium]|nr:hypothetical protein [Deltaproteobacteria bacterium]
MSIATVLGLHARLVWLLSLIHGALRNRVYPQVWLDGAWVNADPSVAGARLDESPKCAVAWLRGRRAG